MKRARLSFERLRQGWYYAQHEGRGYEIRRTEYRDYRAKIFEPVDADEPMDEGVFPTLAAAQIHLRQEAGNLEPYKAV